MTSLFKIKAVTLFLTVMLMLFTGATIFAQTHTQTVKGMVFDKDAKIPLIGANVMLRAGEKNFGVSTDADGYFKIPEVPVGRFDLSLTYIGYEPTTLNSVLLTSGKELNLQIEMVESAMQLEVAVVVAKVDKNRPLNEMATVSARTFSIEETSRYAASLYDPARMAQNFAGVSSSGGSGDLSNEIIVRGNSPKGVLWRLEGIEIPNPNHFAATGNSGGAISMLSSSTLSNSDFYTGAFPSEFGNATSGVFDLNLRNGNNEKREYAFMLGALGVEAAAEGPFSSQSRASYLINYRYSTLAALEAIGLNPVDVLPKYEDLSFKVNLPTANAGVFALFGLGGRNNATFHPKADSTTWESEDENEGFSERQRVGTIGLSHRYMLSDRSYLKTVFATSYEGYKTDEYYLDLENNYQEIFEGKASFNNVNYRLTSSYTNKLNARNTVRTGFILSHMDFDFVAQFLDDDTLRTYIDKAGNSQLAQAYAHWKHRFNDQLTLNSGFHYTHFLLNDAFSIEPRFSLEWKMAPGRSISAAAGIHSRPEHIAFYFVEETIGDEQRGVTPINQDLKLSKALHTVLGYDQQLGKNMRLKAELYYQYLYDVPVQTEAGAVGSAINTQDVWSVLGEAANEGTGTNYGIDLTLEKFFSQQYYFLLTGSLFDSKFTTMDGRKFNTRYNSNYQLNLLAGKEFKVGKKKNNTLGFNGKVLFSGGNRVTPIDLEASKKENETVFLEDQLFNKRAPNYFRFDVGVSYRINAKKMTHTISLDIQNVTNRQNVNLTYFDSDTGTLKTYYHNGLFPNFNYRIEF